MSSSDRRDSGLGFRSPSGLPRNPRNGKIAGATGLESATSCVTGRCSDQLNYVPANLNQQQTAVSIRIGNGKSACRKRSPKLASILCGTSNLELTIMPGRVHE